MHQDRDLLQEVVFIHAKIAMIFWGLAYWMYPPEAIIHELGRTLVDISSVFAIFGSILGIYGLVLSNSKFVYKRHQGNIIEFAGLLVALCGPLGFLITVGDLTIKFHAREGYSVTIFAYALCAFMLSRLVTVRREMVSGGYR